MIAVFKGGESANQMAQFLGSLYQDRAQVAETAGSVLSLDYQGHALLIVWGPHVTTANKTNLLARLQTSGQFQSIKEQ